MFFPHNASEQSISVFFNGRMCSVPASDPGFETLRELLAKPAHDHDAIEQIIDKPKMITRLSEGLVDVVGSTVMYKGEPIHSTLAYRLMDVLNAGENAAIWARFLERVMSNPSDRSRECLYDFLNAWKAPITEDGHFIAFKRVRGDYRDIHSGTFDNSPGQIVQMPREKVNSDPDVSCSYGLHVAATSYLGKFYAYSDGYRVVAVKVDPADVVAVPRDYGFAKMRVCRYLVIGDAEESFYNDAEASPITYAGTEPATGDVVDMSGYPICYNAVDFAENWRRDMTIEIEIDTKVAPSAVALSMDAPKNKFIVGVVTELETFDPDEMDEDAIENLMDDGINVDDFGDRFTLATVRWQDGSTSENLVIVDTPIDCDLVAVEYVGPEDFDGEEEDEDTTCPECEDYKASWQAICDDCQEAQDEEEDRWLEEIEESNDDFAEMDHIATTGLTRSGEVPPATLTAAADVEGIDTERSVMAFERAGVTYTETEIKAGIKSHGQRGYSRLTGVPRTTLQDWVTKIEACED